MRDGWNEDKSHFFFGKLLLKACTTHYKVLSSSYIIYGEDENVKVRSKFNYLSSSYIIFF